MVVLYTNPVGKSINNIAVVSYYFAVFDGIIVLYVAEFLLRVLTPVPVGEKKKASPTENSNGLFGRTN